MPVENIFTVVGGPYPRRLVLDAPMDPMDAGTTGDAGDLSRPHGLVNGLDRDRGDAKAYAFVEHGIARPETAHDHGEIPHAAGQSAELQDERGPRRRPIGERFEGGIGNDCFLTGGVGGNRRDDLICGILAQRHFDILSETGTL